MTLYQKLSLLEQALNFYANQENYKSSQFLMNGKVTNDMLSLTPIIQDKGLKARHALDKLFKGEGSGPDFSNSTIT